MNLPLLKPTCQPHQKCFTSAVRESSLPAQNNRKLPTCDWEHSPLKNSVCTVLDHCYITGTSALAGWEEADRNSNDFWSSLVDSRKVWFPFGLPECFCKRTLFWRRRKKGVRRRRERKRKRESEKEERRSGWDTEKMLKKVTGDLAEMWPPVTFVLARRYRRRLKPGWAAHSFKSKLLCMHKTIVIKKLPIELTSFNCSASSIKQILKPTALQPY